MESTSVSAPDAASQSLINSLPVEILSKILQIVVWQEENDKRHYIQMFKLASICTVWKSVIDTNPSLWSLVHDSLPLFVNQRALERSGGYPLTICIRAYRGLVGNWSDRRLSALAGPVCSHMHRWHDLALDLRHLTPELVTSLTSKEVPLLNSCQITLHTEEQSPLELFGRSSDTLEQLSLINVRADLQNFRFPNLRYIEIGGAEVYTGPLYIVDRLTTFLNCSPNLRTIILSTSPEDSDNPPHPPPGHTIPLHLPHLTHFEVAANVAVVLALATSLETARQLDVLSIEASYYSRWPSVDDKHLEAPWKRCFRKFFPSVLNLEIRISTSGLDLIGQREEAFPWGHLQLKDWRPQFGDPLQGLEWLADCFEAGSLVVTGEFRIRVSLWKVGSHAERLIAQLRRLDRATCLTLMDDAPEDNNIRHILPTLDGQGLSGPCFPMLDTVNCWEMLTDGVSILAALGKRYELYLSFPRLKALELVHEQHILPETIRSMEELLGPGVVRFQE